MSNKRLTSSIKTNIDKLDAKITVTESELATYKLQRGKYVEMLELLEPKASGEASKEPSDPAAVQVHSVEPEDATANKQAPFHAKLKAHAGDAA
jgi:hypothetical protein